MKESLKRDLNKTYLILSSEEQEYEETYEIEMIVQNTPKTLLPLHVLRVDGGLQLYYDVSSKQTLRDCAGRAKTGAETIYALFEAVDQLKHEMKDYLLDMERVILDLSHIYVQEGTFYFCYCPWESRDVFQSFREMLEEILGSLDYHDTRGVELAYHLYQSACRGNFEISQILEEHRAETVLSKDFAKEERPKPYEPEKREGEISGEFIQGDTRDEDHKKDSPGILRKILQFFLKKEEPEDEKTKEKEKDDVKREFRELDQSGFSTEERGTEVLGGRAEQTVLLDQMPVGKWRLRPLTPGYEEFCITEDSFLVGKKREAIDGYIGRETISRVHSRLVVRDGRLYIADANSTNGTFVNGTAIEPGTDVEIFSGDRILFADVGYECYNSL